MVTKLPEYLEPRLSEPYGPIRICFTLQSIPDEIDAPFEINEDWIGVEFPVRAKLLGISAALAECNLELISNQLQDTDKFLPITGVDAMYALSWAGKAEASDQVGSHASYIMHLSAHNGLIIPAPGLLAA